MFPYCQMCDYSKQKREKRDTIRDVSATRYVIFICPSVCLFNIFVNLFEEYFCDQVHFLKFELVIIFILVFVAHFSYLVLNFDVKYQNSKNLQIKTNKKTLFIHHITGTAPRNNISSNAQQRNNVPFGISHNIFVVYFSPPSILPPPCLIESLSISMR
jgi:hypothetical protein